MWNHTSVCPWDLRGADIAFVSLVEEILVTLGLVIRWEQLRKCLGRAKVFVVPDRGMGQTDEVESGWGREMPCLQRKF